MKTAAKIVTKQRRLQAGSTAAKERQEPWRRTFCCVLALRSPPNHYSSRRCYDFLFASHLIDAAAMFAVPRVMISSPQMKKYAGLCA